MMNRRWVTLLVLFVALAGICAFVWTNRPVPASLAAVFATALASLPGLLDFKDPSPEEKP